MFFKKKRKQIQYNPLHHWNAPCLIHGSPFWYNVCTQACLSECFPINTLQQAAAELTNTNSRRELTFILHPCVCACTITLHACRARLDAFDCAHACAVRCKSAITRRPRPAFLLPGYQYLKGPAMYLPAHRRTQMYTKRTRGWGWTQRYGDPWGIVTVPLSDPGVQQQSEGGIHLFRQWFTNTLYLCCRGSHSRAGTPGYAWRGGGKHRQKKWKEPWNKEKKKKKRITQRERDKMTKSVMLSSSKQQQVDARPNAKLDFFAPVMKLGVSVAEPSKSQAKTPLVHCCFISSQYCLYWCATKDTFMTESAGWHKVDLTDSRVLGC